MSLAEIWLTNEQLEVMEPDAIRETVLERAIAAGKIVPESREQYREMWDRDLTGTVALLASLEPGVTPAQAKTLHDFEQQQEDELLASARLAIPELGRRASGGLPPVRLVASTHKAGWYRRTNGSPVVKDAGRARTPFWQGSVPPERPTAPTPFPAGLNVGE